MGIVEVELRRRVGVVQVEFRKNVGIAEAECGCYVIAAMCCEHRRAVNSDAAGTVNSEVL